MVTQLAPRPAVSGSTCICKSSPFDAAGHERMNRPPEIVGVILAGGRTPTDSTVTDPSRAKLFATVKPGETIVIEAPPTTGPLMMVNLSPAKRFGPTLTSFKVPPELLITPVTETTLFDGDNALFNVAKTLPEIVRPPAVLKGPTHPTPPGASVPPESMVNEPLTGPVPASVPTATSALPATEPLSTSMPLLTVVLPEYVSVLGSISVPVPCCTSEPDPLMTPPKLTLSAWLKAIVPLSVTLPNSDPLVPPLPICSVPALMVVGPVK